MTNRLDNLKQRLESMSATELKSFIEDLRRDRKTPKHHEVARTKKKIKAKDALSKYLEGMSPEDLERVIANACKD